MVLNLPVVVWATYSKKTFKSNTNDEVDARTDTNPISNMIKDVDEVVGFTCNPGSGQMAKELDGAKVCCRLWESRTG